jgi:hypothetical protein
MSHVKIISGHTNPGGSTIAHINLCNLFNERGLDTVFYGPHDWHLDKCRAEKTGHLEFQSDDHLIVHYLVMPERPAVNGKVILSCHEKHYYPIAKIKRFWDGIHFVSAPQRDWHHVDGTVIPNKITGLVPRVVTNCMAGVIGSIHPHKQTHTSINRALADGYSKILLYGEINDPGYFVSHIKEYIDSGQAELREFEDDMQKMYDSVEAVYHSSESETFNMIKAECAVTGTRYHGINSANPDVSLFSDDQIFNAWMDLLGISKS